MKLGAFSNSLAVKDLSKSKAFYEVLGFEQFAGEQEQGWIIMRNGAVTIGLFQDMFEHNILTFNPGWDQNCQELSDFDDVRTIQQRLLDAGYDPAQQVDAKTSGPGHCIVHDPDGNAIMFDQHI